MNGSDKNGAGRAGIFSFPISSFSEATLLPHSPEILSLRLRWLPVVHSRIPKVRSSLEGRSGPHTGESPSRHPAIPQRSFPWPGDSTAKERGKASRSKGDRRRKAGLSFACPSGEPQGLSGRKDKRREKQRNHRGLLGIRLWAHPEKTQAYHRFIRNGQGLGVHIFDGFRVERPLGKDQNSRPSVRLATPGTRSRT